MISAGLAGENLVNFSSLMTHKDVFGYVEEELGITEKQNPLEDGNKEWIKPLQELSMATNFGCLSLCFDLFGSQRFHLG